MSSYALLSNRMAFFLPQIYEEIDFGGSFRNQTMAWEYLPCFYILNAWKTKQEGVDGDV